jgi:apolipoprotein N-acyltransferase
MNMQRTTLDLPQLAPRKRLLLLFLGYGIYVLAGPGILLPGGSPLGALGLIPWALACSRPGPWKKCTEYIAGAAALTIQGAWMGIVFWFALVWLFLGYGCWAVWGGALMKRLARHLPLALATPLAWIGFESLLAFTPTPLGLSWLRLGHYMADFPLLAGSGRVWGVMGIGFVLASIAGFLGDCLLSRSRPGLKGGGLVVGAVLATAVLLTAFVRVPESEPGPRVMLVQPAIEQARKQHNGDPMGLFLDSAELTQTGMEALEQSGFALPHLVSWGETMTPGLLCADGLLEQIEHLEIDPWNRFGSLSVEQRVEYVRRASYLESGILDRFFGEHGVFRDRLTDPSATKSAWNGRTQFLCGAEMLAAHGGRLCRTNAVVLWDPDGRRSVGVKQHLAPGGETMHGLETFSFVRDLILNVGGYVPDLIAGEETQVMELDGGEGRSWRMATSICFDNAYADVYASPLRSWDVDFHMVVSNEAWYEDAQELDQMVAFSRMHALCTGRSFVRCANSGVSCAIGPDGAELARLRVGESDRQVRGTLVVDVPVPTSPAALGRTPYIWLQPWLLPLGALLPLLALLFLHLRVRMVGQEA